MAGERLLRILALLSSGGVTEPASARLCDVCAEITVMSGAGIMLMSDDVPLGSVCTTNEVSRIIEDLQFTLGEGPCVDAYNTGRPVLEPDLADPDTPRWLAFSPPALAVNARAVFGFPLQVGVVCLGAMNLYRDRPGPLTDDQHADGLVLADVAAQVVLAMQADAPLDVVAEELEIGANFHLIEHQASGMVAAQLGVSVGEALMRLRAYAFGHERALTSVAQAVVDRRLRFDPC
ncbi:MAG TPA: GAF and ANTAR domain-containing protein [Acidimicrobiales bacterium]|nr:GAF and ANTAR domain-containing protein [Acidimicrobiales bacterium]